jgi:transposase
MARLQSSRKLASRRGRAPHAGSVRRRYELTDEQWDRIRGLLPAGRGRKARPAKNNRVMVNGMIWVRRTGAPWRDLPLHYGPWNTVYTRFSRWGRQGVWRRALNELAKDADPAAYMVDATIVRVHQDGQHARKGATGRSGTPVEDRQPRSTPSSMRSAGRSSSP